MSFVGGRVSPSCSAGSTATPRAGEVTQIREFVVVPSDLKRHNEEVRKWDPRWPSHWISFWHGNDGDYCFSYDTNGHPWIVYWDYNAPDQFQHLQFEDAYLDVSFAEWYAG